MQRARVQEPACCQSEDVAEFDYRPIGCKKAYRVVVVRKNLSVEKGQTDAVRRIRYFFYITNDRAASAEEIVFSANDRCDQENLIEQLKNGVQAMRNPVDNLVSNWAYMVMAALAWTLKAWCAPAAAGAPAGPGRRGIGSRSSDLLKMEFKRFLNALMRVPLPDHPDRPADHLPAAVVEPVAGSAAASGRGDAPADALLRRTR